MSNNESVISWEKTKRLSKNRRSNKSQLRDAGKEHKTLLSKKVKPAKVQPLNMTRCKCSYHCNELGETQMKTKLFELYHSEGMTHSKQMSYLLSLLEIMPVKRRRNGSYEEPGESRRQCTVIFMLPNRDGKFLHVCKKTFLETFSISHKVVQTLVAMKKKGETIFVERRGGNRRAVSKYTPEDRSLVQSHIDSFPRDVSHYTRNTTNDREYLSGDLSVLKLYRAFKDAYPDNKKITFRYYQRVFESDFPNLSFRPLRVDTCKTCDRLNIISKQRTSAGREAAEELRAHHTEVSHSFDSVKRDFSTSTLPNSDACTITIDLQKVFALPKLTHSNMYYSRQLSCYNFGIHVADTNTGIMVVWHEGIAKCGANEIASCLLRAVNSGELATSKRTLIVYSDNCAGQLKNQMLIYLYFYFIALGFFDVVEHKFLVSGHSFSASDRDFALIEKTAKKSKLNVVDDVIQVLKKARLSEPKKNGLQARPFRVIDLYDKPIFDFSSCSKEVFNTTNLQISKCAWIRVEGSDFSSILTKKTYDSNEEFLKVPILKKGVTVRNFKKNIAEINSITEIPIISAEKLKDLSNCIEFLPEKNRKFYRDLFAEQAALKKKIIL